MTETYPILDRFEVTELGVIVTIDGVTEHLPGQAYMVRFQDTSGKHITAEAFKERLRLNSPTPVEHEGYLLKNIQKSDIPENAALTFVKDPFKN